MNKLDQEKKCWLPLIPPSAPPDAPHCSHSRHTSASAASAAYAPPNQKLALPTLPSSSQLPQFTGCECPPTLFEVEKRSFSKLTVLSLANIRLPITLFHHPHLHIDKPRFHPLDLTHKFPILRQNLFHFLISRQILTCRQMNLIIIDQVSNSDPDRLLEQESEGEKEENKVGGKFEKVIFHSLKMDNK